MKPFQYIPLFVFLFVFLSSNSQRLSDRYLNNLHDEELLELFNELHNDSLSQERVARIYLNRARKEKDTIKMARGYDRLARIYNPKRNIQFADSVIELTKKLNNITYPALGYAIKGLEYLRLDDLVNSSENFFKSFNWSKKNNNVPLQVYSSNFLIQFKSVWGNKREALELQKERHKLIMSKDYLNNLILTTRDGAKINFNNLYIKNQLSSLQNFTICYINLKEIDSARFYIKNGFRKVNEYKGNNNSPEYYYNWFYEASIEVEYYSSNFDRVLAKSDSLLSRINTFDNSSSIINLFIFRGLDNLKLNKYIDGIKYLEKADSLIDSSNSLIIPQQRILFEELLNYYRLENNNDKRLLYLNKLLHIDSIFKINYQYFEPNFIRNYETPKLLSEKEELIFSLKEENTTFNALIWAFSLMLLISLLGLLYYFKRQLLFKKRFEEIMDKRRSEKSKMGQDKVKTKKISSEIISSILNKLDNFEANKYYLSKEVSLNDLAKEFNTNPNYLSQIINIEKEKNFSQYINDLRLEFAFQKLAEDDIFRRYTIIAIANDSGFKRAESFSSAFYKKYRIYPSFYIKKLNEN